MGEQRQADRETVRRRYGELLEQVSAPLYEADPISLSHLTSPGEYDPEACTIIPRLEHCHCVQDVHAVIYEEFVAWFGLEPDDRCFDPHLYLQPAEAIWNLWQRYRSNNPQTPSP